MKYIYIIGILLLTVVLGCQEDDFEFGDIITPTNLQVDISIADDNSGNVVLIPTAENAINFHVVFSEGAQPVVVGNGLEAKNRYTTPGEYQQQVQVIAFGRAGVSSSIVVTLDLDVDVFIDPEILQILAGDGSKNWVWDSSNAGHFGVGDPLEDFPNYFSAAPNQLNPCLYDDVLTFNTDLTYNLETTEASFINWSEVKRFFPDATPGEFADECRDIDSQIETTTTFSIIDTNGVQELVVTNSMLSYWSGAMSYTILELSSDKLIVRGIQDPFDPPGDELAWYHTFVPQDGSGSGAGGGGDDGCETSITGDTGSGNFDVLVWSDEFNTDGPVCSGNWKFDLGAGGGWGNNELQYYTDRPENIKVENGNLVITAKAEQLSGAQYTSSRIRTQDNFEFQYGRVEIRAKLPTGGGTWPALWMLGADLPTNPWPGAGEIDIMEHRGNEQDLIKSTLHFPGNSGGDAIGSSTIIPGVSDNFNTYEVTWSEADIRFAVNGNVFYVFPNSAAVPFNKDFFLIMNVAMGGDFGGEVDPNFVASTMEVDYIRVYQ